ncbi:MAG: hypothetical protein CEE38_17240 [Planctomycetes bacterium B3_Pla]|nr:MAG: hypothetical protein CEE38_17240 [Planctomycetes bacterium B3_Pla]
MKCSVYWIIVFALCACGASARAEDGILLNPGFEEGGKFPMHWSEGGKIDGVDYVWDKGNGYKSKASLCLYKTVKRYFPIAQWYQIVERDGSSPALEISAQVKAKQVTKAIVDVAFLDGTGKWISHKWASYIGRKNANDPAANHNWKVYSGRVDIPTGTKKIQVALQIYGPGKVWFDDIRATYADLGETGSPPPPEKEDRAAAQDDIADIESKKLRVDDDPEKTYFLIQSSDDTPPPNGRYKLLVVLPGGDGSEAFHPFVKRIYKYGLPRGYLLAQIVAVRWIPNQQIVWPQKKNKVPKMNFSTEEFIESVIADIKRQYKIDGKHVFTLSWSSGGPAAYAASLQPEKSVTGSYVAMSVFNKKYLPPLTNAKGYSYYIEHSPDDRVCPFWMAERAKKELAEAGATVNLSTYKGGHGWRGNMYERIRKGTMWLEENTK